MAIDLQLGYDNARAQWMHNQKTQQAIMGLKRIPFEPIVFPLYEELYRVEDEQWESTLNDYIEELTKRAKIWIHLQ